jgi:hypothetical protein
MDPRQRPLLAEIVEVLADGLRGTSKRRARSSTITRPEARAMLRISVWRLDSPATARKPYGKGVRAMVRRFTFPVNAAHRLCRPSSRRKANPG